MMSQIPIDLKKVNENDLNKEILRVAIGAELDAVSLYEQLAAMTEEISVVLVDLLPGVARGKALDIAHASALVGVDVQIVGTGLEDWGPTEGSDFIINTAGAPRKHGQTREELAKFTVEVLKKKFHRKILKNFDRNV